MDPVRNPYAPGAGQRPPELAGRDAELTAFDVLLERISAGRPERSLMLTGLRGVGKTVLLNQLRSAAIARGFGTGKWEARPDQDIRRPLAGALHLAVRELAPRHRAPDRVDRMLGTLKAFASRRPPGTPLRDRWVPGIDVPATAGRADSGDLEIDLVELLTDAANIASDVGSGIALFVDEVHDLGPDDVSALCAACHELSQLGAPLILVGAGLPHVPAVLSAAKSYSERLCGFSRIDRLDRSAVDLALRAPADREGVDFEPAALDALYAAADGYPYFVQAYGKVTWDVAGESPITAADVAVARPIAEAELGVGFFGSRYVRATPAEREYLRVMADDAEDTGASLASAQVAKTLNRRPASLSPARDALIKKGLIYSAQRGQIAFTVPHFGRYLRTQT
ncbi:MAG: ATP-binding protein [Geodermatophilaceae bacterium]